MAAAGIGFDYADLGGDAFVHSVGVTDDAYFFVLLGLEHGSESITMASASGSSVPKTSSMRTNGLYV